jgi:hypothetical protein
MYKLDTVVKYKDDDGYRRCLLAAFSIKPENAEREDPFIQIDIECKHLLAQTSCYKNLIELYRDVSMEHVFMRNESIGLCLLFSFQYFKVFHHFLRDFIPLCRDIHSTHDGGEDEINILHNIIRDQQNLLITILRSNIFE